MTSLSFNLELQKGQLSLNCWMPLLFIGSLGELGKMTFLTERKTMRNNLVYINGSIDKTSLGKEVLCFFNAKKKKESPVSAS